MPFSLKPRVSELVVDSDLDMAGKDVTAHTFHGTREVIEEEETLVKQVINPESAGDVAFVVRDAGGTVDRVVFKEDGTGNVRELSVGDMIFSNGYRLTEVEGGIALVSPEGKTVKKWREAE